MSHKKIVEDYFKASQEMNADAMAKDFAEDIEIQNIAPNFTRYIYGINQFKRSTSDEASKVAKDMLAIFDDPKQEISKISEKGNTVEIKISFEGTINKDLGPQAPYKKGEVVKNESRSVFKFNDDDKIILIQSYVG
ncbi:MAG: nuclear transport factor 2 family protein [Neisseriaceae bacterium]|nr:nuclear transport factor 2 family protein [Neisseriaceae bacterium]